jgi:hypothetical protein
MRGTVVVAWREFCHYRFLPAAAAAAALLPLIIPYVPGVDRGSTDDVRQISAVVIAWLLAFFLSLFLGSVFIGRDLSEGRLSFYFVLPVRGASIWFGKLFGLRLLLLVTQLIVIVPAFVISPPPMADLGHHTMYIMSAGLLLMPLVLLLIVHAISTIVRTRSPWIAADIGAAAVIAALGWLAVNPLIRDGASVVGVVCLGILGSILILALFTAGAIQVATGRTDHRRSHRALSYTLWGMLTVGALGVVAYSFWVRNPAPKDIVTVHDVVPPSRGDCFTVSGKAWGRFDYWPVFLVNASNGRYVKIGTAGFPPEVMMKFSEDGDIAVVLRRSMRYGRDLQVTRYDLNSPEISRLPTLLTLTLGEDRFLTAWACSPDGSRIAYVLDDMLCVYDFADGRPLMSDKVGIVPEAVFFVDRDTVRAYLLERDEENGGRLRIIEADLLSQVVGETGSITVTPNRPILRFVLNQSVTKMLLEVRKEAWDPEVRLSIRDAVSGEIDSEFGSPVFANARAAYLTADEKVVVATNIGDRVGLRVLDADGSLNREIDLGPVRWLRFGHQPSPERVLIQVSADSGNWQKYSIRDVNLKDGTVVSVDGMIIPWSVRLDWHNNRGYRVRPPGGLASRLFLTQDRQLMIRDPRSGDLHSLLGDG